MSILNNDVIWLDSYKDFPNSQESDKDIHAEVDTKTGKIYAIRGLATEEEIEHERAHIYLKHSSDNPITFYKLMKEELKADLMAYQKLGKPEHIKGHLIARINEAYREYGIPFNVAVGIIRKELNELNVPKTWKEDLSEIVKEY
jgi:hypothetical protein